MLAFGLSDQTWSNFQLPLALGAYGMPGCSVHAAADEVAAVITPGSSFTSTFAVPASAALLGLQAYMQGFAFDPPANAAGVTASNGLALVLGGR